MEYLRGDGDQLIERISESIKSVMDEAGIAAEVSGREKVPFSIWRKMERDNISFEQLSDTVGFRIIVDSVPDCYQVLGVVHGRYRMVPGRFKDYVSTPKRNNYRSIHTTVIGPEQRRIEIQSERTLSPFPQSWRQTA